MKSMCIFQKYAHPLQTEQQTDVRRRSESSLGLQASSADAKMGEEENSDGRPAGPSSLKNQVLASLSGEYKLSKA